MRGREWIARLRDVRQHHLKSDTRQKFEGGHEAAAGALQLMQQSDGGLHIANTLLVFLLLRRFVQVDLAACAGTWLFAIHPLQVEPVAWVSGTRQLLAGCCSLA